MTYKWENLKPEWQNKKAFVGKDSPYYSVIQEDIKKKSKIHHVYVKYAWMLPFALVWSCLRHPFKTSIVHLSTD